MVGIPLTWRMSNFGCGIMNIYQTILALSSNDVVGLSQLHDYLTEIFVKPSSRQCHDFVNLYSAGEENNLMVEGDAAKCDRTTLGF